ncbi:hypothetical protein SY88_13175 [Clostridiales bacterium PH28_bin88]|nr:hypothetical protein SY88_13175 [Clostridiales bacterium PH28_bin88]
MEKQELDHLLTQLMGKPAQARQFQFKTALALMEGRNVVLTAPTGSGKTWAPVLPFLYSWLNQIPFADRLIYALPLRSLASGLYQSTRSALENAGLLKDEKNINGSISVTLQTGNHKGDPFFCGDLIFTTIDQLLYSYLNLPLSVTQKLANVNAGALLGSLVILDEVHLLEPRRSFATVLEMARRLRDFTSFVFMTATLSSEAVSLVAKEMQAVELSVESDELLELPSHKDKQRTIRWTGISLNAHNVLEVHDCGRSIVVCNSVQKAQTIYRELNQAIRKEGYSPKIILLHSRFLPSDREEYEKELARYFGPDATETDCILVATQVIEAGLDISADNLHTEVCPANSLVQRAGRCARYAGDRNKGTVWVYDVEKDASGRDKLGPYRERYTSALIISTREKLSGLPPVLMDFYFEQRMVSQVHGETEFTAIQKVIQTLKDRRKQVNNVLRFGRAECGRDLVRDVDSVNVLVHAHPENLNLNLPWQYLSVPRASLWSLKTYLESGEQWVAKVPVTTENGDDDEAIVQWKEVKSIDELVLGSWLVSLNPAFSSYNKAEGLCISIPGAEMPMQLRPGKKTSDFDYCCEMFAQHLKAAVDACRIQLVKNGRALKAISQTYQIDEKRFETVCLLSTALHDVGKLSVKWQNGIRSWQKERDPGHAAFLTGEPLAHSTFTWETDREKNRDPRYFRGNHACEGAFAVFNCLVDWCAYNFTMETYDGIATASATSIARHHSAQAKGLAVFQLEPGARDWINQALATAGLSDCEVAELLDSPDKRDIEDFTGSLINPESKDEKFMPLYWFLVRQVRLADQAALASKEGGD